jgi:Protein of unknown function (DUF1549)/Protein of unknown function (DUF1553)
MPWKLLTALVLLLPAASTGVFSLCSTYLGQHGVSASEPTFGACPKPIGSGSRDDGDGVVASDCHEVTNATDATDTTDASVSRDALIKRLDGWIAEGWQRAAIEPSARSSDSEFLRRVTLDLTGVVPRVAEVRSFLADMAPDKRERVIDRLLESPRHATHLANQWRDVLLPGGVSRENLTNAIGVQNWLRARFSENLRYDRFVSEFLVVNSGAETGPALFYTTLELKPEKLAAATARVFLGLRIECAECHHHPFDKWRQEEFWGYAAFFARLRQPRENPGMARLAIEDVAEGEVRLPTSDAVVAPAYPDGSRPRVDELGTRREQLAVWMAARDNPFLARAAVNRVWSQLFGRGLVEPVDDLGPRNPPSHPEVLEAIADYFVATGFDLRELYRTLTRTRAYQLSSAVADSPAPGSSPSSSTDSDAAVALFARMEPKPLSADQLYDALLMLRPRGASADATMGPDNANPLVAASNGPLTDPRRVDFLARFPPLVGARADYSAGIPQTLTLLNGPFLAESTKAGRGGLAAALGAPWLDTEERVRILFLATLSRFPDAAELPRFADAWRQAEQSAGPGQAAEDILWALVNSAEFAFNH